VLRQCILSSQLKAPLLRTWAEQELNGYSDPKDVPEYRIMTAGAFGYFDRGFGGAYPRRPIPASLMEPEHRWAAQRIRLVEPVSSYEAMQGDPKGHLIYSWRSDMVAYYEQSFVEDCTLISAWQELPKTAIIGVLDTIRTRVLTMAIDIKDEFDASGVDLTHMKAGSEKAQKIQQSIVNNVYGNLYMIAGDHVINTQNITVGNCLVPISSVFHKPLSIDGGSSRTTA
jgi:hypothetical protein